MKEIWKKITGYEDYEVSNYGNVRSYKNGNANCLLDKPKLLSTHKDGLGRLSVLLHKSNNPKRVRIHRLVLNEFIGKCPNGLECCHNDGNPSNNHIDNLRWDTHKNNCLDRKRHGKEKGTFQKGCVYKRKLTDEQVMEIKKIGRTATLSEIASHYPVGITQISNILLGYSWRTEKE